LLSFGLLGIAIILVVTHFVEIKSPRKPNE
jgi:hypothetical protein